MITPEPSTSGPEGQEPHPGGPAPPLQSGRVWAFATAAAVAAGIAAFAIGEAVPTPFQPPVRMERFMGNLVNRPTLAGIQAADRKNAMLDFGILGGSLAFALGLVGGMVKHSIPSALIGAFAGLTMGAGLGAGTAAGLVPVYHAQLNQNRDAVTKDLTIPLLIHAGLWAAVGSAAGAALAIGAGARGRAPSVVLSGLIGAALGAALYEVSAALLSPDGRTYQPIASAWPPRLLAATVCPMLASALAAFALVSPAGTKRERIARPISEVTT